MFMSTDKTVTECTHGVRQNIFACDLDDIYNEFSIVIFDAFPLFLLWGFEVLQESTGDYSSFSVKLISSAPIVLKVPVLHHIQAPILRFSLLTKVRPSIVEFLIGT